MLRSDYLELPLYLDHHDEDYTVNMYAHLRDKSILTFTNVSSDPIRYEGWWTISHTFAGREVASHLPAGEVLYFTSFSGKETRTENSAPETRESSDVTEEDLT